MAKNYFVYILCSKINGTLYVGITNNLQRRIYEHKSGLVPGFTAKYNVQRLVYFEETKNVYDAISREKQLKGWTRAKKISLIESVNLGWNEIHISLTKKPGFFVYTQNDKPHLEYSSKRRLVILNASEGPMRGKASPLVAKRSKHF